MDVRCERCDTEYELEESKVPAAGVTVKCASCGNLFRVRRKNAPGTVPPVRAVAVPPPLPVAPPAVQDEGGPPTVPDEPRDWMVRSPDGEIRRFREFTTLQRWIVERKVTRVWRVSRSGEAWKALGEIAELAPFFEVVDAAAAVRSVPSAADRTAPAPYLEGAAPVLVRGRSSGTVPVASGSRKPQAEVSAPWTLNGANIEVASVDADPGWTQRAEGGAHDDGVPSDDGVSIDDATSAQQSRRVVLADDDIVAGTHRSPVAPGVPSVGEQDDLDAETRAFSRLDGSRRTRWLLVGLGVVAALVAAAWFALRAPALPAPTSKAGKPVAAGAGGSPASPVAPDAGVAVSALRLDAAVPPLALAPSPDAGAVGGSPREEPRHGADQRAKDGARDTKVPADYDAIVTMADDQAMRGDCRGAVLLYERALLARPNGVTALVGLAYCHLDRGDAGAAVRYFRAALAISPRYEDALFGMAEALARNGDKSQAAHFYRRYLEFHPRGTKASGAKKQLQLLGESELGPSEPSTNQGEGAVDSVLSGGTP